MTPLFFQSSLHKIKLKYNQTSAICEKGPAVNPVYIQIYFMLQNFAYLVILSFTPEHTKKSYRQQNKF